MTSKPAQERPTRGGSYIREKDGTLTRREFTRQRGEAAPDKSTRSGAVPEPQSPPPPKAAGKDNKEG